MSNNDVFVKCKCGLDLQVKVLECLKCGHKWFPRPDYVTGKIPVPKICSKCMRDWRIPLKYKLKKKEIVEGLKK